MDACKCPITDEVFQDPVIGDDGHTYERKAITDWLTKNATSPITRQPMNINSLKTNYTVKKIIEELRPVEQLQQIQNQFQLDIDIKKTRLRPLFQGFGKSIYEVEWIKRKGPPIILLKIDGAKAKREASFYVQLSCHPHIVRTFGFVKSNPGSVMLLQESAPHGDLSELLRENGFKPNETVLWEIFKQICDAMICLADNGIVHGDLACRNVLVFRLSSTEPKENLVKLTDFGLTHDSTVYSMIDSPALTTMTIIPVRYVAPEILRNPNKSNYTERSDVYSMGVLMWEACSYGQLPYCKLANDEAVQKRKLNDERLQRPPRCSHQLWELMNQCWHQEPLKRPTFKTLKESMPTLETKSNFDREQKPSLHVNRASVRSPANEHNQPDDIVYIPCEYCNELIDLLNWSLHTAACLKVDEKRLENLAQQISQASITAQIPCDYCKKLCSADQLIAHEVTCYENHLNSNINAKHPRSELLKDAIRPTESARSNRNNTLKFETRQHYSCSNIASNQSSPYQSYKIPIEKPYPRSNNDQNQYPPYQSNNNSTQQMYPRLNNDQDQSSPYQSYRNSAQQPYSPSNNDQNQYLSYQLYNNSTQQPYSPSNNGQNQSSPYQSYRNSAQQPYSPSNNDQNQYLSYQLYNNSTQQPYSPSNNGQNQSSPYQSYRNSAQQPYSPSNNDQNQYLSYQLYNNSTQQPYSPSNNGQNQSSPYQSYNNPIRELYSPSNITQTRSSGYELNDTFTRQSPSHWNIAQTESSAYQPKRNFIRQSSSLSNITQIRSSAYESNKNSIRQSFSASDIAQTESSVYESNKTSTRQSFSCLRTTQNQSSADGINNNPIPQWYSASTASKDQNQYGAYQPNKNSIRKRLSF